MQKYNINTTSSCRQFARDTGMSLTEVAVIAGKLNLPKNGTAPNSSFVLTPAAKIRILEKSCEAMEVESANLKYERAERLASRVKMMNESLLIAEQLVSLAPLTGSRRIVEAAAANLAEHKENKNRLHTNAQLADVAGSRLNTLIREFAASR